MRIPKPRKHEDAEHQAVSLNNAPGTIRSCRSTYELFGALLFSKKKSEDEGWRNGPGLVGNESDTRLMAMLLPRNRLHNRKGKPEL